MSIAWCHFRRFRFEAFNHHYLPKAIDEEILKNDTRDIKEKMASLRLFDTKANVPTVAGMLLLGKNPEYFYRVLMYNMFDLMVREGIRIYCVK